MPRHVIFILEYESKYKLLLNYKEWKDEKAGQFKIVKTFSTEWLTSDKISLSIEGQTMDAIYEVMAGQVSGFGTTKSEDTKRLVELEALITKGKKEVEALQKKIRNERQLSRQMDLNGEARSVIKQIAQWQWEVRDVQL